MEALRPGGLFLCASEEAEAYGHLRRGMRILRPAAEPRLSATVLDGVGPVWDRDVGGLLLHAYRKSAAVDMPLVSVTSTDSAAGVPKRRCFDDMRQPPEWAMPWQKLWVEPGRPNVDLVKALKVAAGMSGGGDRSRSGDGTKEPKEWYSAAVEIVELAGKGRGLVITRDVQAGELLFVSRALFSAPAAHLQTTAVNWLCQATPRQRQQFYSLFDGNSTPAAAATPMALFRPEAGKAELRGVPSPPLNLSPDRVCRILALNGFKADKLQEAAASDPGNWKATAAAAAIGASGDRCLAKSKTVATVAAAVGCSSGDGEATGERVTGLWTVPALLNHCCTPTTVPVPLTQDTLAFVAAFTLSRGSELTNRYVVLGAPRNIRRQELWEQKGFACECSRCQAELAAVPEELTRKLTALQDGASRLELPPEQFQHVLGELATVARRELHGAADQWVDAHRAASASSVAVAPVTTAGREAARAMMKGSFLPIFSARAMAFEELAVEAAVGNRQAAVAAVAKDASAREEAWREVCEIMEEVEPCSPNHIEAASQLHRAVAGSKHAGLVGSHREDSLHYLFAVWLGRHGLCAASSGHPAEGATVLSEVDPKSRRVAAEAFARALASAGDAESWINKVASDEVWEAALRRIQRHGFWARQWAVGEALVDETIPTHELNEEDEDAVPGLAARGPAVTNAVAATVTAAAFGGTAVGAADDMEFGTSVTDVGAAVDSSFVGKEDLGGYTESGGGSADSCSGSGIAEGESQSLRHQQGTEQMQGHLLSSHEWQRLSTFAWRLRIWGYAFAHEVGELQISATALRLRPAKEAERHGRMPVELNFVAELGSLVQAESAKARFMKGTRSDRCDGDPSSEGAAPSAIPTTAAAAIAQRKGPHLRVDLNLARPCASVFGTTVE
eukprot:TRINITY_DN13904_c0_g1_i1.p1 TRINITY_DN13904_c0_g1~~TRINITY_DN13904_c0_g1_i1.p1  ORF type:complete len:1060 (-),score=190.57 TRINITY_DN13904_c0_g1_i1:92-2803(-)